MGKKALLRVAVVVCAALLLAVAGWAQALTSLRGVVTDPSGATIPGAKVTLFNPSTNATLTTTTAVGGVYTFPDVLPGTYTLTVEATGFQKYEQSGLVLRVALPATVDVQLKVGAITEVVKVSGRVPLLNTSNASIGESMGLEQVSQLPLDARSVPALLSLQPGVAYTGNRTDLYQYDTRGGAVNGERSDQNTIKLDGVVVNDQFQNGPFDSVLPITGDSVEEFRVTTSNYGANSGRSAGAQIELVTKGGTNDIHGSVYEYNRTQLGEANDFFIKNAQIIGNEPNVPPHLVRNIFGASIGGPFMKNRFFYFFNFEGLRQSQSASAVRTVPSMALRDGVIMYRCYAGDPQCTGGSVTGISGQNYVVPTGSFALNADQLKAMDPLGIGPNTATLAFFNKYPKPNDFTVGDPPNFVGYRFAAPASTHHNWMIGRLDYKLTSSGNQSLFIRGSGEDDTILSQPYLPSGYVLGGIPETSEKDLNKGFVVGYTATSGPHWVNNLRYGLTHQSVGVVGNSDLAWIYIRDLNDNSVFRSHRFTVPVHNIIDAATFTHGSHSIQFGANLSFILRNSLSQEASFSDGVTNADWNDYAGIAGTGDALDPYSHGYPDVYNTHAYDFPLAGLMGIVTEVDAQYNTKLNSSTSGTLLPQGAPLSRHYRIDDFSFYLQDTWQMRSNLTVTYGLRWGLMSPIGETSGQEVAPTMPLGQWFEQRASRMRVGLPSNGDPLVSFAPAGPSYNKPGYYPWQKRNFAPRLGIAWTPRPSVSWLKKLTGNNAMVVRAGMGMYYDHFGPALALAFDQNGAFGLSTALTNYAGCESTTSSPRVTSMNAIPVYDNGGSCLSDAPTQIFIPPPFGENPTYPATYPTSGPAAFAITWGLDSGLRTPYSYAVDFSIDRQLTNNMALNVTYVGHFAHRLLVQEDLATPYNLTDPVSGVDYFSAAARFSQLAREGVDPTTLTNAQVGPTAQFWQDIMMPLAAGDQYSVNDPYWGFGCDNGGPTSSPVVAAYQLFQCTVYNETLGQFFLDLYGVPGTQQVDGVPNFYYAKTGPFTFYNPQYSSLYGWRSIGYSNYNSLQVTLTKRMSHGLLFNFNYTYSKSLDIGSDATSIGAGGIAAGFSAVINAWEPYQLYGPSDFDLRHQVNANWVWQLPFGRGRTLGRNVSRGVDAVIGGWQISGVTRWTSGFPGNANAGYNWSTDWELGGNGILTGQPMNQARTSVPPTNTATCYTQGGWNMFSDPCTAIAGFDYPYPGQSGVRNAIRGDGYASLDMGLAKTWHMPYNENHTLQFRWDVFNVPNLKRFDVASVNNELDLGTENWGQYTRLLTQPRIMQFALRYEF